MCFCFIYHGALNVLKSSCALCPRFFVCFSIVINSLGEEGAGLCASRTFVLRVYVFVLFLFLLVSSAGCNL